MTIPLKIAIATLAIAGATLTSGCATRSNDRYSYSDRYGRDRDTAQVSVAFGNVGCGYRDGYWDNGHQWRQWSSDSDRDNYRTYRDSHYNDWNHDRDGDDGWHGN